MDLVRIDSISGEEGRCCKDLQRRLARLELETHFDNAHIPVNGDTGNLIAHLSGRRGGEALLLSAHMDTVEPGRGIVPRLVEGVFTSDGTTILGADDKSAVAVILEVLALHPGSPAGLSPTGCRVQHLRGNRTSGRHPSGLWADIGADGFCARFRLSGSIGHPRALGRAVDPDPPWSGRPCRGMS